MSEATLPQPSSGITKASPYDYVLIAPGIYRQVRRDTGETVGYLTRFMHDGERVNHPFQAENTKSAIAYARAFRADLERGKVSQPSKLTCAALWGEWKAEWLVQIEAGDRRLRSYSNVETRMRLHILPVIGSKRVEAVKRTDILAIVARARTAGLSSHGIDSVLDSCSGLFRFACDREYLTKNPAHLPRESRPKVKDVRETYCPSNAEVEAVIDATKGPFWKLFLLLLSQTGVRVSEGLAIRWQDVDFERNLISVNAQVERGTGERVAPKTDAGVREIPMTTRLHLALRDRRKEHMTDAPDAFVFAQWNGRPETYMNALRFLRRSLLAAKIDTGGDRWAAHAFRHHFITQMILGGADLQVVAGLVGHADGGALILRTYSHVFQSLKKDNGLHALVEGAMASGAS